MTTEIKAKLTLDGVQQVQTGLQATAAGMDKLGQASGRANQQTAQVSAQLQDFFVQIQAGQSPVTAFIQQGSQLSAVFGGFGNAFRAVTALITPAVVGIGAAAAAIGTIGLAYSAGAAQSKEFANALSLTGNAAGLTEARFNSLADSIGKRTLAGVGTAREALQTLVASGKLSGTALEATAGAAASLSRATGEAVGDVAKRFAGFTDNVAESARKLNEQYNFLSAAQYAQIKALEESGNKNAAVEITMRELEARANSTTANLGTLERAWGTLTRAVAGYGEALKKIGRTPTTEDQIGDLRAQIAQRQAARAIDRGGKRKSTYDAEISALSAQLELLSKASFREQERASAAAAYAAQQQAGIRWIAEGNKYLDKQAQMQREIKALRVEAKEAGKSDDDPELAKRIAFVTEKYAEKAKAQKDSANAYRAEQDAAKEWARTLENAGKLQADAEASTIGLSKAQAALVQYLSSPAYSINSEEMRQMAVAALIAANAAEQLAKDQKEAAQAAAEGAKLYARQIAELNRAADAAERNVAQAEDEAMAAAMVAASNISLAEAIATVTVERLKEQQVASLGNEAAVLAIQREIDARQKLISLIHGRDEVAAVKKAADEELRIYERTFDKVGDALFDALNGSFASAKRLIESEVIRPVVQAVLAPITGAVTSALIGGLNGGNAAGTIGGLGSATGLLSNFLSTGSLSIPYNNLAMSAFGQSLGLSTAASTGNNISAYSQSLTPTGEALGTFAESAGSFVSYADALMQLKAGKWGTAAGEALGTYIAGPIGGLIGKIVGSAADKFFSGGAGTPHTGGYVLADASGGATDITRQQGGILNGDLQAAVKAIAVPLASALNDTAKVFGQTAAVSVRAVFEADGHDASSALFHLLDASGKQLTGSYDAVSKLDSDPTKGFAQFAEKSATAARDYLQSINLPKWANEQLAALGDSVGVDALLSSVKAIDDTQVAITHLTDSLKQLPGALGNISAQSSDAVYAIAQFAGGLDVLSSNVSGYYGAFYSESERAALGAKQIAGALSAVGLALPATREAFRALVDSQDLTQEAGQKAFAVLMGVAGAFDQVTASADRSKSALTDAIAANISKFRTPAQNTASSYSDVAGQLSAAGVNVSVEGLMGASKAEILAFSTAFSVVATNSDDAKTAVWNAAGALADLKDAAADVANQRVDLQIELLRAQGQEQAALNLERQREIDALRALDPALASMRQSINDAIDAAAFATKVQNIQSGVDGVAGDFLQGSALATYKASRIQQTLAAGGIDSTVPGILGSTKEDLLALWNAVGVDGKQAILSAYGAWKELQDVLYGTSKAVADYRAGTLGDAIEAARLKTLKPEDRIASLKATERTLFGRLATAKDPVAAAEKLQSVIIQRIGEESALREKVAKTTKDSLQEQIDAAQRLKSLSGDIRQFTGSLSFSDLSPLSRRAQVGSAQSLFESTLQQARGGDKTAQGNLLGNARAYLEEASSAYASGPAYSSIYQQVTSALNSFGAAIQADPQLQLLQDQYDALSNVSDNSDDMLAALLSIDSALGGNAASTIASKSPSATGDTSAPTLAALVSDNAPVGVAAAGGTSVELVNQTAQLSIIATHLAKVALQTEQLAGVVARQDAQLSLDRAGYLELRGGLGSVRDVLDQIKGELQIGGAPVN